jgi:hypothetical protein
MDPDQILEEIRRSCRMQSWELLNRLLRETSPICLAGELGATSPRMQDLLLGVTHSQRLRLL